MIPNRFRDPALRTRYFKKSIPNESLPPCPKIFYHQDGTSKRVCDLSDSDLGIILIQIRESAMVTRALKIATSLDQTLPENNKRLRNKITSEFLNLMRSTWNDYVPPLFYDLNREAQRRGLIWNELGPEQDKRLQVEFEESMMNVIQAGLLAVATQTVKAGRAERRVQI